MKATQQLHDLGQSLWLDNITRGLLASGTLRRYINALFVTGLTSNPTIFDKAIKEAVFYDEPIHQKTAAGRSGEALFFELALEDLIKAADLLRPVHDATEGMDGWVSLEVSPLLANDTAGTTKAATELHDGGDAEARLAEFARAGVDETALASRRITTFRCRFLSLPTSTRNGACQPHWGRRLSAAA